MRLTLHINFNRTSLWKRCTRIEKKPTRWLECRKHDSHANQVIIKRVRDKLALVGSLFGQLFSILFSSLVSSRALCNVIGVVFRRCLFSVRFIPQPRMLKGNVIGLQWIRNLSVLLRFRSIRSYRTDMRVELGRARRQLWNDKCNLMIKWWWENDNAHDHDDDFNGIGRSEYDITQGSGQRSAHNKNRSADFCHSIEYA